MSTIYSDSNGDANSESTSAENGSSSDSIVSKMTLDKCIASLTYSMPFYQAFSSQISKMQATVSSASAMMNKAQVTTLSLVQEEDQFSSNLGRLKSLYNQLGVRLNVLSDWMLDEKFVRDRLAIYYNALTDLHGEQIDKAVQMQRSLDGALHLLSSVESSSSSTISRVANSLMGFYGWAKSVTNVVDEHTVKLDSVSFFFLCMRSRLNLCDQDIKDMPLRVWFPQRR